MFLGNVIYEFLNQYGFTNSGTAEKTYLTATGVRSD